MGQLGCGVDSERIHKVATISFMLVMLLFCLASILIPDYILQVHMDLVRATWFITGFISALFLHFKKQQGSDASTLIGCLFFGCISLMTIIFMEIYLKLFINKK